MRICLQRGRFKIVCFGLTALFQVFTFVQCDFLIDKINKQISALQELLVFGYRVLRGDVRSSLFYVIVVFLNKIDDELQLSSIVVVNGLLASGVQITVAVNHALDVFEGDLRPVVKWDRVLDCRVRYHQRGVLTGVLGGVGDERSVL